MSVLIQDFNVCIFSDLKMQCNFCNFAINKCNRATYIACLCTKRNYCDKECQQNDWAGEHGHKVHCEYWARVKKDRNKRKSQEANNSGSVVKAAQNSSGVEAAQNSSGVEAAQNSSRVKAVQNRSGVKATPNISGGQCSAWGKRIPAGNKVTGQVNENRFEASGKDVVGDEHNNNEEMSLQSQGDGKASKAQRSSDGRFMCLDSVDEKGRKSQHAITTANYKDFDKAKARLQSIIDRNIKVGADWAFKISCQKNSKHARLQAHQWQSDNFDKSQSEASSDEDEPRPTKVQRFCKNCKNRISGPQWSYLVCGAPGCRKNMTHFECIGFEDISAELAIAMRKEYMCKSCHRKLEEIKNADADFAVNNVGGKKKKKQETNDPKNRATETGTGENPCNKRMARSASNEIENPGRKKPKTKKSNPSGSTLKAKTSDSGDNRKPRDKTTKEKTCESVVLESPGSPPFEVGSDSDKDFV